VLPNPNIKNQLMQPNEKHEMQPDTSNIQNIGLDQRQNEGEDHHYTGEKGAGARAMSHIVKRPWFKGLMILLVGVILIAITVVIHVQFADKETDVSRNLELWFVFLSFIYTISFVTIVIVEIVPDIVKRFVRSMTPTTLEMLKMRLEVTPI
jgi:threonine/homoserine/homoserine lactone efflux protein